MIRNKLILGLIQVAALSLFAMTVLPAENTVQSTWTASPLQIDGQSQDWTGDAATTEKGVGVDYAFRNDGRDLYVLLIFKDPKSLSSIDRTGITVYASTLGKKDKDWGVKFLKKTINGAQLIEYMEKMGQPLSEERKEELKDKPQFIVFEATAVNKKGEEIFPAGPVQNIDLPGFRIGRQENMVLYEFRIPLASREIHPAGIGTEPGKDIKIGFEWGGLTKEMREAMRGRPRGTETGADANRDEQTTGSYMGPPPSVGPAGPKKYSFWVDVKLAQAE
jgi:hypothetical protein